ncbi:2-isopropylmalate synthase 2, mitochondrial [Grifola frondosa]|uniref:2-isopropylmalate synthase 2, mitochondrial n=1 Tax=Grifola frondosa TaxID=5627 RepID=A0A1C7LNZ4_GRIFR|nr:2-isopropylmalate synthase 2, mitochondrial [Grifola frondosa]
MSAASFDGTLSVDVCCVSSAGMGNGPLSALLDALRTHLDIDLSLREYTEHAIGTGQDAKAASYVELVAPTQDVKDMRRATESWWGVGVDADIAASGLRAVLSAVNSAIGDRALPELKLSVGFNAKSGQADIASAIVNSLGLELPRRLQASFFEVVQRAARDSGEISYTDLITLFRETYGYETHDNEDRFAVKTFKFENLGGSGGSKLSGDFLINGKPEHIEAQGNGPLSAAVAALNSRLEGKVSIREYAEHSIGEGSEVKAASYVEFAYEADGGAKKLNAWGIATDTDITASGLKAVMCAARRVDCVVRQIFGEK